MAEFEGTLETFENACIKYNIPENLTLAERERLLFAEIFRTFIIPEVLDKKEKMGKYNFLEQVILPSLYRYRKIEGFNIDALKGG